MLQLLPTADGSFTLRDPARGITYHSTHGAWGEAQHVFIQGSQLTHRLAQGPIRILEVGFGTGLNFAAAALAAQEAGQRLHYIAYEPHPLPPNLLRQCYHALPQVPETLQQLIAAGGLGNWETIELELRNRAWPEPLEVPVDVVFFDAFDPKVEPLLWQDGLKAACACLGPGGVLVTYSVTRAVKELVTRLGYTYQRLPGWGWKKHMLRVTRIQER